MLKPWQKIDPEKEFAVAVYQRAIGLMSYETFQQIRADCKEMQRQKENFERKQKVKILRNKRRFIIRLLQGRR